MCFTLILWMFCYSRWVFVHVRVQQPLEVRFKLQHLKEPESTWSISGEQVSYSFFRLPKRWWTTMILKCTGNNFNKVQSIPFYRWLIVLLVVIHEHNSSYTLYPFSHNHRSGTLPQMKGNYYWRDPFFTSMIMGEPPKQVSNMNNPMWSVVYDTSPMIYKPQWLWKN